MFADPEPRRAGREGSKPLTGGQEQAHHSPESPPLQRLSLGASGVTNCSSFLFFVSWPLPVGRQAWKRQAVHLHRWAAVLNGELASCPLLDDVQVKAASVISCLQTAET